MKGGRSFEERGGLVLIKSERVWRGGGGKGGGICACKYIYLPHRFFDLQDSLNKLMHFLLQLSDFVPLKNGFYSFRAQTD